MYVKILLILTQTKPKKKEDFPKTNQIVLAPKPNQTATV